LANSKLTETMLIDLRNVNSFEVLLQLVCYMKVKDPCLYCL